MDDLQSKEIGGYERTIAPTEKFHEAQGSWQGGGEQAMKHFIGGAALGFVVGIIHGSFSRNSNNIVIGVIYAVFLGIAAWGLLP